MDRSGRIDKFVQALPSWVPNWARDWRKVLPGACIIVALIVLLVTVGPGSQKAGPLSQGANRSTDIGPGGGASPADGNTVGNQAPGTGAVASGPATQTGALRNLPASGAGSGLGSGGGGGTYKGVSDKTALMGFTWQHAQCGGFSGTAIAAAFGVPQAADEESIKAAIEFFESHPIVAFPDLPPELAKGVSAKTGYWGRRVKAILADNGGPFCGDQARATAVKLAEQDGVLGTVQIPNDGANQFIAPEMAARKRINIGGPGFTRDMYSRWEPYVYDITFSGTDIVEAWASWACRDLWGRNSFDTGDVQTANKRRVFALVYPDGQISGDLAKQARDRFARCGGSFKVNVAYPTGIDQQPGAANNAIANFKTNGVTSVYMLTDPLFSATLTSASTSQVFFPEWSVSSIGFNDIPFVIRHFYDEQQRPNIFGASHLSSSDRVTWSQTPAYKAWKLVRPDREPPGGWNNWYLNIFVLYAGMLGAGPALTPTTFLEGLNKVCGPCDRTSKRAAYLGFGKGDTTGIDDFTVVKFNPNKEDTYDPPDEYGRRQLGYWDFPERGLRYLRSIDRPER